MQTENLVYYIGALVVLVVVFLAIKKMTSCLIKSVIMIAVLAALAYVYLFYWKVG